MRLSITSKLVNALERGEKLTLAQVKARYKLKDPAVAMSDLRLRNGYAIENGYFIDTKGRVTRKWWLGTPPKHIVAMGYRTELNNKRKNHG